MPINLLIYSDWKVGEEKKEGTGFLGESRESMDLFPQQSSWQCVPLILWSSS